MSKVRKILNKANITEKMDAKSVGELIKKTLKKEKTITAMSGSSVGKDFLINFGIEGDKEDNTYSLRLSVSS